MSIWEKIIYSGWSEYNGEIQVVEFLGGRRLIASGFIQSRSVHKEGNSEFYWSGFADGIKSLPEQAKVLILGFGAGTVGLILKRRFPSVEIDGVEIDQNMIDLGNEFFGLDEVKARIFVEDAEKFVERATTKYDLICVDLFKGDRSPKYVFSGPFATKLKKLMKPSGIIIFNKIYDNLMDARQTQESFSKAFKFLREFHSSAWNVPGNLVLYGENK